MSKILFTTRNNPSSKTIGCLISAANRLSLDVQIIHTKKTQDLLHVHKTLNDVDFAMHRDFDCTPTQWFYVTQLPQNTRQLNKDFLLKFTKFDKAIQYSYLSQYKPDIPLIPTIWSFDILTYENLCEYFQDTRFLVKPSWGSFGDGIQLIQSQANLDSYYQTSRPYNILFQKYIPIEWDIRVLILGDNCLGAMRRSKPNANSIVTNISKGGIGEKFQLNQDIEKIAMNTAKAFSLEYAGIDILFDNEGHPYVIEINSNPQFHGFNKSFDTKVEDLILQYLTSPTK